MASGSVASANVLLVDDTPAKLLTYEVMLDGLAERVLKASSVNEALEVLLKTDVALILTDVSMPTIDGFEFAKILREHPRFANTPIIFVTALAQSELDQLHGYASGAVDYLNVPVARELLRAKVKVFLDLYRKQRELVHLKADLERRVVERTADLEASTAELAQSEERYRTLVDNASDIVATLDLDFRFTSVNPAVERILGYTPYEIVGTPLGRYVPAGQLGMHREMLARKLAGEAATQYEMQLMGKGGEQRFTLEVNSKLILDNGKPVAIHSIARDISERKDAEARQTILLRELQHRTKNMLAVIQSIATSTLARSKDLESAQEALIGRLHALGHAQEFVAAGPRGGVPLRQLVEAELSPFAARAIITGEALVVGGGFAQTFALLIHELATNAAKYGALSAPRGRVVINWRIDRSDPEAQLHLAWMERGGPPAKSPKNTGLGTVLMSSLGRSQAEFKDEGFEYALTVPLSEAVRGSEYEVPGK
jgi:PAS domain S-box-containing protein